MTLCRTIIYLLALAAACGMQALELPRHSWVMPGMTENNAMRLLAETARDPVEGIWDTAGTGTTVAIVAGTPPDTPRTHAATYLIVVVDSPRPRIHPGTVIGVCTPYARPHTYDCLMYTQSDGRQFSAPRRFTLTLADNTHLTMAEVRSGLKAAISFTLPLMRFLRLRINSRDDRPDGLDGFIRLWPVTATPPATPRRF